MLNVKTFIMKKNSKLTSKITKYSLLAGAALTMVTACKKDDEDPNDPNIAETDVNPDVSLTATSNSLAEQTFDLNSDGVIDVSIGVGNYTGVYAGVTTNYNYGYIEGENGAEILTQEETISFAGYQYTVQSATPLNEGNTIGSSQVTWASDGALGFNGTYYGLNLSFGQFMGVDKFVGVKFQASGNTHYAWMRLSMSADASNIMVKEYAYHVTPNTPIEAGAK